ncbi:Speckle-type POZ protein-like B [Araneus ventricosus]|uniref:Speckle-type POZ protein-like B n=1 Tax=Araneus ventricosus TaxID=182803 RepID=A0A4Y2FE12_ARAVE|nr:Speckle-type POZ protein-like B [Araneus ventricosus]
MVRLIDSIEIHRKNTAGKFLVFGEIRLKKFEQKFSQFIETGTSIIEISSNINMKANIYFDLRVFANISIISEKLPSGMANTEIKKTLQMKSLGELSKDFERLLEPESSRFADVTLKCSGVSIPAHKIILSARSPVFAAMFANPMKESRENEVDITDVDVSVLRALLVYMYTGKTSDLTSTSAADLLLAAEKYQLRDLKTVCSHYMMLTVSFQNVWSLLVLGDLLSEDLKSFAVDYICNTCGEMSVSEGTEEWKALLIEKPDLALKVSELFA